MAMNQYILAHHGVRGMHWGIRRFQPYGTGYDRKGGKTGKEIKAARKEAKKAAKEWQKNINTSAKRDYQLMGIQSRLQRSKNWYKNNPEVQKIIDKKISDVEIDRKKAQRETERLIKQLQKDSRVVYKTTLIDTSGHDSKRERQLDEKYGHSNMYDLNSRTTAYGTGVKVRAKDSFAGRSKSYNDDKRKRTYGRMVMRTSYY